MQGTVRFSTLWVPAAVVVGTLVALHGSSLMLVNDEHPSTAWARRRNYAGLALAGRLAGLILSERLLAITHHAMWMGGCIVAGTLSVSVWSFCQVCVLRAIDRAASADPAFPDTGAVNSARSGRPSGPPF